MMIICERHYEYFEIFGNNFNFLIEVFLTFYHNP
jgi:hypothetical protein